MKSPWLPVLCCFLLPASVRSQPNKKMVVPLEGSQAFCNILHGFALKPIKSLEELAEKKPAETLLIVFGDTRILDDLRKHIGSLEKFRSKGGAVLIASDRDDQGRLLEWRLRISGEVVSEKIGSGYKLIPLCPMIQPEFARDHALFQGVTQGLATNKPSFIKYANSQFNRLAGFSEGCWSDRKTNLDEVGFLLSRERALVMAGHTVFWNVLIPQPDNDNYIFAQNCVRWLSQGKKKYALFVEDGRIVSQFDVGLTVPIPFPTQAVNRLLRGLENENFFNRLLNRFFSRDQILRTILILVTLVLLLYGCKRLVTARHRIETAVPLLTPLPSPVAPAALTLSASRRQAILQGGDFREPARELSRFFFEELAQMPPLPHPFRGIAPPRFEVQGGWLQRRWLTKQVHDLWQLAHGDPARISKRQFNRLPAVLDRLTLAVRTGRLRFGSA